MLCVLVLSLTSQPAFTVCQNCNRTRFLQNSLYSADHNKICIKLRYTVYSTDRRRYGSSSLSLVPNCNLSSASFCLDSGMYPPANRCWIPSRPHRWIRHRVADIDRTRTVMFPLFSLLNLHNRLLGCRKCVYCGNRRKNTEGSGQWLDPGYL